MRRDLVGHVAVRGPDRYPHQRDGGLTSRDAAWARHNLEPYDDFESFVHGWVTPANVQTWEHFRPQTNFVCNWQGRILVDYVGRFENLDHHHAEIAARSGLDAPLPHINRTSGPRRRYQDA